jgi:hypothetical protein
MAVSSVVVACAPTCSPTRAIATFGQWRDHVSTPPQRPYGQAPTGARPTSGPRRPQPGAHLPPTTWPCGGSPPRGWRCGPVLGGVSPTPWPKRRWFSRQEGGAVRGIHERWRSSGWGSFIRVRGRGGRRPQYRKEWNVNESRC